MNEITHTPACIARQKAYNEFVAKFPKVCKHCYGQGSISYPSTWEEPGGTDLCRCIESGVCPRCGEPVETHERPDFDFYSCPSCGWTDEDFENMPAEFVAPEPFCECWINDEY